MKSKGIRIEDTKNEFQCIDLIEILREIKKIIIIGQFYFWMR